MPEAPQRRGVGSTRRPPAPPSTAAARDWRRFADDPPWWFRWIVLNVWLLILPGIVLALVRGVDGVGGAGLLVARVAAFVLIGRYLASFVRKPGWLPTAGGDESPRRR